MESIERQFRQQCAEPGRLILAQRDDGLAAQGDMSAQHGACKRLFLLHFKPKGSSAL